jgi:hypothetical protein
MKLKHSEIRDWRIRQLGIQDYTCALCGDIIEPTEAVLDHDHKSGLLRQVLHRGCNSMLGKIENNTARSRMTPQRLRVFAENLIEYITTAHTEVLHPTYKTKEERAMKTKIKQAMGRGRGRGKKPPKR